jgi:hypothetical protein
MSNVIEQPPVDLYDLPPADVCDPVIEAYKQDVDRTLLRANLRLSVDERFRQIESCMELVEELRRGMRKLHPRPGDR